VFPLHVSSALGQQFSPQNFAEGQAGTHVFPLHVSSALGQQFSPQKFAEGQAGTHVFPLHVSSALGQQFFLQNFAEGQAAEQSSFSQNDEVSSSWHLPAFSQVMSPS
jgi:hypothetical protein